MDIQKKVNKLVRFYETRDPFEMIKGMNVILISCPLKGVKGFYHYFHRNNIIYIDENLSEHEQSFVCAHELGHMILHRKSNAIFMDTYTHFNKNKYEIEADTFAINLLVPDDLLQEYTEITIEQLCRCTGYSQRLIELRLKQSKICYGSRS